MRKLHLCFPPITVKERHVGCDIPLGWTICRGSWHVTLDEAIAMMNGSISPEISGDEHRTVYRCPNTAANYGQNSWARERKFWAAEIGLFNKRALSHTISKGISSISTVARKFAIESLVNVF